MIAPSPPVLDSRGRARILAQLQARRPGYVPDAALAAGEAGGALASIAARYLEIIGAGLNAAPARDRLAFLDSLGNALLPPQSARAPLVFTLQPQAPSDVLLPSNSLVAAPALPVTPSLAAQTNATHPPEVDFYTTESVTLMRGLLTTLYCIDPASDTYADFSASRQSGLTLFSGMTNVPHQLYLGHDTYFRLVGPAEIVLGVSFGGVAADPTQRTILLNWEYLSQDGWLPLHVQSDTTVRFTQNGTITLTKSAGPDSKQDTILGQQSYWLRATVSDRLPQATVTGATGNLVRVDNMSVFLGGDLVTVDFDQSATIVSITSGGLVLDGPLTAAVAGAVLTLANVLPPLAPEGTNDQGALPNLDVIEARVGFQKIGLAADKAFVGPLALDTSNNFFPFGQRPTTFTTFYLACAEAFQRAGAQITISIALARAGVPNATTGFSVTAEYYNGTAWIAFPSYLQMQGATSAFTTPDSNNDAQITFDCPLDWAQTKVNGVTNFWMRMRIDAGDFGPIKLQVQQSGQTYTVGDDPATLKPPIIRTLTLGYTFVTSASLLDHCLTFNDFAFTDHTQDCRWPRRIFTPFQPVGDTAPAVHFGFSQKPPAGLVSLLFASANTDESTSTPTRLTWEYFSSQGWSQLSVLDETQGLGATGMVQFVGPPDAVPGDGLGGLLWRIRARLQAGDTPDATPLAGVWLNAVWALQGAKQLNSQIGASDGSPGLTLAVLPGTVPVLPGEVLEVQEWTGRGDDWTTSVAGVAASDLRFEYDPADGVTPIRVWVHWYERDYLDASGPTDRHYLVERVSGLLRFGDNQHGMIPPPGAPVSVSYSNGGSLAGNVGAGAISQLRSGAPYVQTVGNPLPAGGGAGAETVAGVTARAPQRLRHRGRAVTPEDYEWTAMEASPQVARARCTPSGGPDGDGEPGYVNLVIVPNSSDLQPMPSLALRSEVRTFVAARAPATVSRRLRVLPPSYATLAVIAEVAVSDPNQAATVEAQLTSNLNAFLQALTGGPDGNGWPFGATIYLSQIAEVIANTAGVAEVHLIRLLDGSSYAGDSVTVPSGVLPAAGAHQLKLTLPGAA